MDHAAFFPVESHLRGDEFGAVAGMEEGKYHVKINVGQEMGVLLSSLVSRLESSRYSIRCKSGCLRMIYNIFSNTYEVKT